MAEDAALIRDQADRCRDILRDMGRAGKDDLHLRHAPLEAVVEEAAQPHLERGKSVHFEHVEGTGDVSSQPTIQRQPEIIHGLRNLVQNAVDFAYATVWIEIGWSDTSITLRIRDDGPGFAPHLLGRIGDPFVGRSTRTRRNSPRPAYEGMGLGLFIAKTLLERSGATLRFANRARTSGAIVEVTWPRDRISSPARVTDQALGENQPISV